MKIKDSPNLLKIFLTGFVIANITIILFLFSNKDFFGHSNEVKQNEILNLKNRVKYLEKTNYDDQEKSKLNLIHEKYKLLEVSKTLINKEKELLDLKKQYKNLNSENENHKLLMNKDKSVLQLTEKIHKINLEKVELEKRYEILNKIEHFKVFFFNSFLDCHFGFP
jgi:hypothetical protein